MATSKHAGQKLVSRCIDRAAARASKPKGKLPVSVGDYSREQHQYICALEAQILGLTKLVKAKGTLDSADLIICENVVKSDGYNHNGPYGKWLAKQRA